MKRTARTHLIEERKHRQWSQQKVADYLGTTRHNISRWEAGMTTPGPYFRARLCELFGKQAHELDLLDRDFSLNASRDDQATEAMGPNSHLTLWNVPYPRNPRFTGRDELLARLAQQFFPEERDKTTLLLRAALTQPQAIKGLGGIGKTQIAVEYAYRSHELRRYTHTFWINAASEETILNSFVALAGLLPAFPATRETDQQKLVQTVKRWLEDCSQPWLLIFDNADDLTILQAYLPQQGYGSLLLTTRAHAVGSLAASIEVENMGLVEGTLFLLQRAQRLQTSDEERDEATNIVIALDGFPLALDQAGAYIDETGCSFTDYLQMYREHRLTLLTRRGTQITNYPDSVATTWSLSFQKIAATNQAAIDLLHLCAFLAPDAIPEELLTDCAACWPPSLRQATEDRLRFQQVLEDLLRFSLIKRQVNVRLLSVHRLVQVVQKDQMEHREQHQWAERVVRAVHMIFPTVSKIDVSNWPQCLRYLEQAQICNTLIREYQLVFPEAAELLDKAGTYLNERASYSLAEPLYQLALSIREQQMALPLNNLGDLYIRQGKYEQASHSYLSALAIWERYLEPDHPQLAGALAGLANSYYYLGKYEQVETLYRRALSIYEKQVGPEHPLVARQLTNLSRFCTKQGRFIEAESLMKRALTIQEQHLEPDHPDLAYSLNGLADLYREQERFAEAEPLFLRAFSIREQRLGPDHPDLGHPLTNLAQLYSMQGRDAEAIPLYQRAVSLWEHQLGPDHDLVAFPLAGLAEIYTKQEMFAEAKPLFLRVLTIWERRMGPEHPLVAFPLEWLARIHAKQGEFAEAEPLFLRALLIQEHTPGDAPLVTAQFFDHFAEFREAQNRHQEAASLYRRSLTIREQVLGKEHPRTVLVQQRLSTVQALLEEKEEMMKNARETL